MNTWLLFGISLLNHHCSRATRVLRWSLVLLLCGAPVGAQTLTSADQTKDKKTSMAGNVQDSGLLTQAEATGGPSTSEVGLQALDLFLTGRPTRGYAKVYLRTTLPITQDPSGAVSTNNASTASNNTAAVSASAISGLLNPYGGIVNLSGGYWKQLAHGTDRTASRSPLKNEGLFLDARLGLKMVNLPHQSTDSPSFGGTSVTPFFTTSVAGRFAHSLYDGSDKQVGLLEASLGMVWNRVADSTLSSAFTDGLLAPSTYAVSGSVAFQLTNNFAITVTASPWSKNPGAAAFGKNYQIGVKVLQ